AESWRPLGPSPLWEGGTLSPPSQTESATGSFQNLQAALRPYLTYLYPTAKSRKNISQKTGSFSSRLFADKCHKVRIYPWNL
ncbi:MAG: hypothetical protein D6750_02130, partial [Bacteroidetes bacterium]